MGDLKETLWALGVCDELARKLDRELAQIPASVEGVEEKARAAKEVIVRERSTLEEAEQTRRSKERELQDCEAKRSKFQGQTAMVKTNAEYTALLNEVDGMTARISQLEEEILLSMETIDQVTARLKTVESEQTQIEQLRRPGGQIAHQHEPKCKINAATHNCLSYSSLETGTTSP